MSADIKADLKNAKSPRISILCPILNVGKYIAETIESVQAQSFKDWELIIMDGVSKDDTLPIIRKYAEHDPRIRLYSEPNEGSWHSYDKTFDLARGDFVCNICGQDGFLDRDWFAKCIKAFDTNPDVSLVWALGEVKTEDGKLLHGKYDTYYGQFMRNESAGAKARNIVMKGFQVVRDLLFGGAERRRVLFDNIFSRHAKLKLNLLTKRSFANGVPQKEDWFLYWLDTGLSFLDLSMMIARNVWLSCIPRYQLGNPVIEYLSDFFYNFNSRGYLAYFIPTRAVFARMHPGNSYARAGREMHERMQRYLNRVMNLREELTRTGGPVTFLDRESKSIAVKRISHGAWV